MTEHEWLTTANAEMLIRFVAPGASDRKLHYYAIACARRIKQLLPDPASLAGIDVLERYVEDEQSAEDVGRINWDVEGAAFRFDYYPVTGSDPQADEWIAAVANTPPAALRELTNDPEGREFAPLELLTTAAYFADSVVSCRPWQRRHPDWPQPRRFHCVPLLRDVFGNPFRPVAFNPAWRTDTAVSLARQMYESKDFSAMPILADALQNAGCENEDVLNHCRDAKQAHVRGCWVVDLVLGKS